MKKTLALILAACMSLSLVACGGGAGSNPGTSGSQPSGGSQSTSGQPSGGDAAGKTVGIAMPTQSLERWNRDGAYLDEQFKAAGYKTIVTYSDNKNEQQVNDIQNMLSQGVDLLIIAAIDGNGLNTVMNDAGAALSTASAVGGGEGGAGKSATFLPVFWAYVRSFSASHCSAVGAGPISSTITTVALPVCSAFGGSGSALCGRVRSASRKLFSSSMDGPRFMSPARFSATNCSHSLIVDSS